MKLQHDNQEGLDMESACNIICYNHVPVKHHIVMSQLHEKVSIMSEKKINVYADVMAWTTFQPWLRATLHTHFS